MSEIERLIIEAYNKVSSLELSRVDYKVEGLTITAYLCGTVVRIDVKGGGRK